MISLKQLRKELDEMYGPCMCTVCANPAHMEDALGFPWCEDHAHHGQLLSWGYRYGYPEIRFHPYAIGQGEMSWWNAVFLSAKVGDVGNEDFAWIALSYVEHLDSLKNVG